MKNYEGTRIPRKKKKLAKKIQSRRTGIHPKHMRIVTLAKGWFMEVTEKVI